MMTKRRGRGGKVREFVVNRLYCICANEILHQKVYLRNMATYILHLLSWKNFFQKIVPIIEIVLHTVAKTHIHTHTYSYPYISLLPISEV